MHKTNIRVLLLEVQITISYKIENSFKCPLKKKKKQIRGIKKKLSMHRLNKIYKKKKKHYVCMSNTCSSGVV